MRDAVSTELQAQISSLRRQVRLLYCCVAGAACLLLMAGTAGMPDVIRARGIVIADAAGHERIQIGDVTGRADPGRAANASIVVKSATGQDRVVIGQEPDPTVGGKVYRRLAPGWGMLVNAPDGAERGGFGFLDGRGASISIDRPTGDAMGMLVDERSGLAAFVLNYDNGGRLGTYPTALELGTKAGRAFLEARNRDGSPAGSLVASGTGRAAPSEEVDLDKR